MAEYIDREAAFDAITDLAGKAPTRLDGGAEGE